jgi:hypothetical protein
VEWSALTEEKQTNQLAQTEFRLNLFIKIKIIRKAGAIASRSLPPNQLCTEAKDGRFQGGHYKQIYAVESIH